MLYETQEIALIETLGYVDALNVMQQFIQDVKACIFQNTPCMVSTTAAETCPSPISATFLIVCLKPHMMESKNSLNCGADNCSSAESKIKTD